MAELADLFISEKHKALLLMALDTHIRKMFEDGCCDTALDMYIKLENWLMGYDAQTAAAAITMIERYGEEIETIDAEIADREAEAQELVDELDDEDAMLLYEALCERLGAAPDVDVPNDALQNLMQKKSIFEEAQIDLEEAIAKAKAADVITDVNPNEFYPCDVEPAAFIDSVFGEDAARVHPLFSRRR